MALHSRIANVLRKPSICPVCGELVWDIVYGTGDMTEIEFLYQYRKNKKITQDGEKRILHDRKIIHAKVLGSFNFFH